MALGRAPESFSVPVEAPKQVVSKPIEQVEASVESSDQIQTSTRGAMENLFTEVLDGQKAQEIVKSLEKGGEKALTVEQKESIHAAREVAVTESASPEFVRGAGKALLAQLESSPQFAGMGGSYMESAIASV